MAAKSEKGLHAGLLVLRVSIGLIAFYYGSQQVFGVFGGKGFEETLSTWEEVRSIPRWLGILAISSLFAGGVGLVLGLFTRVAAFGLMCTMAVATYLNTLDPGALRALIDGPSTRVQPYAYPFTLMLASIAIMLTGAGKISLDARFFGKRK